MLLSRGTDPHEAVLALTAAIRIEQEQALDPLDCSLAVRALHGVAAAFRTCADARHGLFYQSKRTSF